jgi:hypothetical protein
MTQQSEAGGHSRSRTAGRAARGTDPWLRLVTAIAAASSFALAPALAEAEPLPFSESVTLRHALTVQVAVADADTHVVARAGRHVAEATLAGTLLEDATVERLETSAGPVAIVRATGGGHSYAWLVVEHGAEPAIAWSGRTDLHGDPGERVRSRRSIAPATVGPTSSSARSARASRRAAPRPR